MNYSFQNKKIAIFGAGIVGKIILNILEKKNIKIDCFFDNFIEEGTYVDGVIVHNFKTYRGELNYLYIISVQNIELIINQLYELEQCEFITINKIIEKKDLKNYLYLNTNDYKNLELSYYIHKNYSEKEKLNLNTLDLVITEKCSLKCKECSNLMQYYENPINYSLEILKKWVDVVANIYDEIYEVRIIGGEPFINKAIGNIINYLSLKKNIIRIVIFTNGTIIPNKKDLDIIKKKDVLVSISDYGILSNKINDLKKIFQDEDIKYDCKKIDEWVSCSSFFKHKRSLEQLKNVYKNCCAKNLATLLNGKIYPCPFIANAMNLKAIPKIANDFVSIENNSDFNSIKKSIIKNLTNKDFLESCDFCKGRPYFPEKTIPPHEQIKNKIKYEIIT